jgi:hypothetical protein
MDFLVKESISTTMEIIRYKGKWAKIHPKPYEPESQTIQVAWAQIREPRISAQEAYRQFFEKQRKEARILYPSFRKDVD